MKLFQIIDIKDNSHFINVDAVADIVDFVNGGTEIRLTNGNVIVCNHMEYSNDIFKKMSNAHNPEDWYEEDSEGRR